MKVEIITPEKRLFTGEAKLIQLPGTNGSFEIMNNHAPVISTLSEGKIKVVELSGNKLFFEIISGLVEVSSNKITVLAEG
ncbi:MAG: ATP synthase F1 subunit epsilon [Bacteroidetes bacterium GWA2_32_17]|nr:MAG: ATP synthase F1 subunit epsilon [Bacteroidetes bacterium GWA2_32_17]